MDTVHGRGGVTKAVKPPSNQNGAPALRGLVVRPTVMSPLERSVRLSPYHQSGNPCSSFAWCHFVDRFIHGNGNDSAAVTLRGAQSPCALCRGDRAGFVGKEPREAEILAEPSRQAWRAWSLAESWTTSEMPSREERSLAEENLSRASPGLESLALSEIF